MSRTTYILELERLDGDETIIHLEADGESADRLFCVISAGPDGAGIVDNGYRTLAEVRKAWPDAIAPKFQQETIHQTDARYPEVLELFA